MRSTAGQPELSIIIPTLNEVEALPLLLGDLANQQGVSFEVLVSDGGSTDGTRASAAAILSRCRLAGEVLNGEPGRGRQLNRGAARAQGEWLLFVHADSRLPLRTALSDGLESLRSEPSLQLAGRFTLRFGLGAAPHAFGCYLCEVKARLDLPGTIHGDQGFLLPTRFFRELGGFREDLPVLEDTLLAEKVRGQGEWRRLPAAMVTSPRRFLAEGFPARQTLNALLVNFAMIGWDEPLRRIPDVYRPQAAAQSLVLAPVFGLIDNCLAELPVRARFRIWYATGRHVRGNAWQLMLRRTVRQAFAAGLPPEAVPLDPVLRFRRRFELLTDHAAGNLIAALLTWTWFRCRRRQTASGG